MSPGFRRYTVVALAWTLAVIVWGAYVRASGSGAGCGDHWPACNGELIPRAPSTQTVIEFTHRTTSGLALLSVVVLLVWARRAAPLGHETRRWAFWSLFFMLTEAAFGALLVKAELVANNATASRALAMSIHLINTFLLVGAMVLTAFHAWRSDAAAARWKSPPAQLGLLASVLILVVGVSGSIAALGDTLVQQSITNAFVELLIKLRILHPLIAIAGVASAIGAGALTWHVEPARKTIVALWSLLVLQVIAGLTNVALQAPISMQLVHLLLADAVWVALMLVLRFAVTSSASPATSPAPHPPASALRS